jgi:hypothetical protein
MDESSTPASRLSLPAWLRWNRTSYALMSAFLLIIGLIMWVWYPLVEEYISLFNPAIPLWRQLDWLLLGIFAAMSLLIMAGADLRRDAWLALVGLAGGLVIESWGTQTGLWAYYTHETPPLWILPAWSIATLAIDRLARLIGLIIKRLPERVVTLLTWVIMLGFCALMLRFVWHTATQLLTIFALLACALLTLAPGNRRDALIFFLAGAGLGYFLEVWGTTRQCWTYYTGETPPFFAVLAHGLAAVAFWRAAVLVGGLLQRMFGLKIPLAHSAQTENIPPPQA